MSPGRSNSVPEARLGEPLLGARLDERLGLSGRYRLILERHAVRDAPYFGFGPGASLFEHLLLQGPAGHEGVDQLAVERVGGSAKRVELGGTQPFALLKTKHGRVSNPQPLGEDSGGHGKGLADHACPTHAWLGKICDRREQRRTFVKDRSGLLSGVGTRGSWHEGTSFILHCNAV